MALCLSACMVTVDEPEANIPAQLPDGGIEADVSTDRVATQDMDVEASDMLSDSDLALLDEGVQEDVGILTDASLVDGQVTDTSVESPPFFDTAWRRRVRLDVSVNNLTELVEDVPVFVRIPWELVSPDAMLPNREDIRFVDDRGVILPHSVNFTEFPETHAWVRLAQVDPTRQNAIWLYFDNPNASATNLPMWTEHDFAVLHMQSVRQIFRHRFPDSSGNNRHGFVVQRTRLASETGAFGDVYFLWGSHNYPIEIKSPGEDGFTFDEFNEFTFDEFTVHLSVKDAGRGSEAAFLLGDNRVAAAQYLIEFTNSSTLKVYRQKQGMMRVLVTEVPTESPIESAPLDAYLHLSFASRPGQALLVVNGVAHDVFGIERSNAGEPFHPFQQPLSFGQRMRAGFDEIHVMSSARSADWMQLRQASLLGTLFTAGNVETAPDADGDAR